MKDFASAAVAYIWAVVRDVGAAIWINGVVTKRQVRRVFG